MSIHSEIKDNSEEKDFIEKLCKDRWARMKNPCKGCKYRYPIKNTMRCCIFPSVPKDWSWLEK